MLRDDLLGKKVTVIQLSGEVGVGKTALANRLIEMASAGALAGRFDQHAWQSAHQESWGKVVSQLAQKLIGKSVVFKATKKEIEDRVITFCIQNTTLLVIDNIEVEQQGEVVNFINRWLETTHKSVLMLTLRKELEPSIERSIVRHYKIIGLTDPYPQLELLGNTLRQRFGDESLLKHVGVLNGIPLNLLYLRYLDPKSESDLKKHVTGLIEEKIENLSALKLSALEDVLASLPRPPTHFMALGVIRHLQFDERLLAFFWDCMGGGSSEAYIELREKLVSSHLLIPVSDPIRRTYRVSEDIHRQLYRALSSRIGGEERVSTVHFFASEYYRRVFESGESPLLDSLNAFVYHCFASGEHTRAYNYLFESKSDILPSLHQAGMALQLQDLLQSFLEKEDRFSSLQRCKFLIEIAHVCSDLSQFDQCLNLMDKAVALLQAIKDEVDNSLYTQLSKRIWYYSAVAYSNTGRSNQCLRSYFKIVSAAWENGLDPLACLSLSYLAHDLKYRDIDKSLKYGQAALEIAREIRDPHLIAKSLCSVAETYIYARQFENADLCFKEASECCQDKIGGVADRRELGRVLKNWGLVALIQKQWDVGKERLTEARELSSSTGDRRRVATADLYLGILYYHLGNHQKAETLMLSAIKALDDLGDGRYLVPALMMYVWWKDHDDSGQLKELATCKNCDKNIITILSKISNKSNDENIQIYADFWRNFFRPVIFELHD